MSITLKELREKANLTQEAVAAELEVTANTVQNWEKNNNIPKPDMRSKLLELYGIKTPAEQARIIGELGIIGFEESESDSIGNVPIAYFDENSTEIEKIKNCWATAEELDMLGYAKYVANHQGKEKQFELPLEFSFFEKYGGYNATLKKMEDVCARLGRLQDEALSFAKQNPFCEFRLTSLEKDQIVEEIGVLLRGRSLRGESSFKKEVYELYDDLKIIGDSETVYSINGDVQGGALNRKISEIQRNNYCNFRYDNVKTLGKYEGFVTISRYENKSDEYMAKKEKYASDMVMYEKIMKENPEMRPRQPQFIEEYYEVINLTERGKQFLAWFQS